MNVGQPDRTRKRRQYRPSRFRDGILEIVFLLATGYVAYVVIREVTGVDVLRTVLP